MLVLAARTSAIAKRSRRKPSTSRALILANTLLLNKVHLLVAEDVVTVAEAVETVVETAATVKTVVTVVTEVATVEDSVAVAVVATEDAVVIALSSEADAVVHVEELMFLKLTTPRRSPAWVHSMVTLRAHDHQIWYEASNMMP